MHEVAVCPKGYTTSWEAEGSSSLSTAGEDQIYLNKAYLLSLDGCNCIFVQIEPVQEIFKLLIPVSNTC